MSNTILLWAVIIVVALGAAWLVWKLWSSNRANRQHLRDQKSVDTVVRDALQGRSFSVGQPLDFSDGDLRGYFRWLNAEGAWGLRLEHPKTSLRPLNGMSFPLWIRQGDGGTWVLHKDEQSRLTAYNTALTLVFPKELKEGDQIRLGGDAKDRTAT